MTTSLPQLRWPSPAAISSPGGDPVDHQRKDLWVSSLPAPSKSMPVKTNRSWEEIGFSKPLFGLVASSESKIWGNEPSPLFGPISPSPSITSSSDSSKSIASPQKLEFDVVNPTPSTTPTSLSPKMTEPRQSLIDQAALTCVKSNCGSPAIAAAPRQIIFDQTVLSPSLPSSSDSPKMVPSPRQMIFDQNVSPSSTKLGNESTSSVPSRRQRMFSMSPTAPSYVNSPKSTTSSRHSMFLSSPVAHSKASSVSPVQSMFNQAIKSPSLCSDSFASKGYACSHQSTFCFQNVRTGNYESVANTKNDSDAKSPKSLPFADHSTNSFSESNFLISTPKPTQVTPTSPVSPVNIRIAANITTELTSDQLAEQLVYDLWSIDHNDESSCDDAFFCVDSEEQLLKTELCRNWGPPLYHCQYGDTCNFAHGEGELRERIRRGEYKSKLCDEPVRLCVRSCTYTTQQQSRCNYCHPGEAIRRKCSRPYFDSEYFLVLAKEYPTNSFPFGIFL